MSQENKVALVTGASKGIGEAVARGLAADGFNMALTARSSDKLEKLKAELLANSSNPDQKIEVYAFDVRDETALDTMLKDVVSKMGRIDLLFNNAGIFHKGTLDLKFEEFTEMMDINLRSAYRVLQGVVPIMQKQKSGTIVNLSSRSGVQAKARSGGYAASKFALVGLSEAIYRDITKDGIKVTALCPGWVDTDMAKMSGLDGSDMIQCDDIVNTIRWLYNLSPSACVNRVTIESIKQV